MDRATDSGRVAGSSAWSSSFLLWATRFSTIAIGLALAWLVTFGHGGGIESGNLCQSTGSVSIGGGRAPSHHVGSGSDGHLYTAFLPKVSNVAKGYPPGIIIPRMGPTYFEPNAEYAHCEAIRSHSPYFNNCDIVNDTANAHASEVVYSSPASTIRGKPTIDAIDRMLRYAWSRHPPNMDLYIRTGRHGIEEIRYLLPSVTLFWPRLGKIIFVLDHGDQEFATQFVPKDPRHTYEIRFEHVPCMLGHTFNQVSSVWADKHSDVDYIVVIDSDCVFHSPVTPDLLFGGGGKLRLPYSAKLQPTMWGELVEWFTGRGTYTSHIMTSQPLAFHRSSFKAFREWFEQEKGKCYLDAVNELLSNNGGSILRFCWMCQIGTFMEITNQTTEHYDMADLDSSDGVPYQRFAMHVPYEKRFVEAPTSVAAGERTWYNRSYVIYNTSYVDASQVIVREGLCRALGSTVLTGCADQSTRNVDFMTFRYTKYSFNATETDKSNTLKGYLERIRLSLQHVGYP